MDVSLIYQEDPDYHITNIYLQNSNFYVYFCHYIIIPSFIIFITPRLLKKNTQNLKSPSSFLNYNIYF